MQGVAWDVDWGRRPSGADRPLDSLDDIVELTMAHCRSYSQSSLYT